MTEENSNSNLYNETTKNGDLSDKKISAETNDAEDKSSSKSLNSTAKPLTTKTTDDPKTDEAVDDIVHHESDEIIEIEDNQKLGSSKLPWYKKIFADKRLWVPLAIVIVLIIIMAVPLTRYKTLGLFLKQTYKIELLDNQTSQPISAANITIAGKTAQTDNQGKANIKVKLGQTTLLIDKKYYKNFGQKITVGLKSGNVHDYKLQATGRQVALTIVNVINAAPIANAEVDAAGTKAKSDTKGIVNIVLPAEKATIAASLSGDGFNNATATIQIVNGKASNSTFKLTPSGKIYFLSNASGTIDVVSTNLDGTSRQTILAGSGNEDPNNTSLLASRDWKYLALESIRDKSGNNQLNLINTSNNLVTNIDKGAANFTSIGWVGHYFVYEVNRSDLQTWQPGATKLKSYNADNGKITILFTSSATGSSDADAQYQNVFFSALFNNKLVYDTTWYQYPGYLSVSGQQDSLISINPDGTGSQILKSVDAGSSYISSETIDNPDEMYFNVTPSSYNASPTYFELNSNNSITQITAPANISQTYPTYLLSPNGNQTFWSEPRDGKNTLFVGDQNGNSGKQIASLSDYTPYGWFTDNYLLVEKNGSELYIMPTNGSSALKISDYYKPAQNFNSYGGGYGGQ